MDAEPAARLTPLQWGETLSGPPVLNTRIECSAPMLVRRWRGVTSAIEQPALDQHYVTLHLGGAKRVTRRAGQRTASVEVTPGAFSLVPAGASYSWRTEGPVDFAHVYLDPRAVDRMVAATFDRDWRDVHLCEPLGARDLLVETLLLTILEEASAEVTERSFMEELQLLLLHQLLRAHSTLRASSARARYAMAPRRLRRALDFIEAHLAERIGVHDIAAAAGMSTFHFSRAFREETGLAPYALLVQRRVERAKLLFSDYDLSLSDIARRSGFQSPSQFSRTFKRATGLSPQGYRAKH